MRNNFAAAIGFACLLVALTGCVPSAKQALAAGPGSLPGPEADARLKSGDRVQVTVFGEEGLTGSYDVAPSGMVQLPLIGPQQAEGRTAPEFEAGVRTALRRTYLRDPKVTVAVVSRQPFYVLGEVEKPGEYPYRAGLNLWRALAVAGGQTYRASTSTVMVQHAGETTLAEVDVGSDILVQPGDLIRVPERWF